MKEGVIRFNERKWLIGVSVYVPIWFDALIFSIKSNESPIFFAIKSPIFLHRVSVTICTL